MNLRSDAALKRYTLAMDSWRKTQHLVVTVPQPGWFLSALALRPLNFWATRYDPKRLPLGLACQ